MAGVFAAASCVSERSAALSARYCCVLGDYITYIIIDYQLSRQDADRSTYIINNYQLSRRAADRSTYTINDYQLSRQAADRSDGAGGGEVNKRSNCDGQAKVWSEQKRRCAGLFFFERGGTQPSRGVPNKPG